MLSPTTTVRLTLSELRELDEDGWFVCLFVCLFGGSFVVGLGTD